MKPELELSLGGALVECFEAMSGPLQEWQEEHRRSSAWNAEEAVWLSLDFWIACATLHVTLSH